MRFDRLVIFVTLARPVAGQPLRVCGVTTKAEHAPAAIDFGLG